MLKLLVVGGLVLSAAYCLHGIGRERRPSTGTSAVPYVPESTSESSMPPLASGCVVVVEDRAQRVAARAVREHDEGTAGADGATQPDSWRVALEVVDALGWPRAGVRVGWVEYRADSWEVRCEGLTGADGWLVLERPTREPGPPPGTRCAVAPFFVDSSPTQFEFDLEEIPDHPLHFSIAEAGTLVVQLTDWLGTPLELDGHVNLQVVAVGGHSSESSPVAGWNSAVASAGRAVLEHVRVGAEFEITAFASGWHFDERRCAGPVQDGDVVVVNLPALSRKLLVAGRALDGAGRPLADAWIEGHGVPETGLPGACSFASVLGERSFSTRTGADGRFAAELHPSPPEGALLLTLATEDRASRKTSRAATRLPETDSWRVDLGELPFEDDPVLARGRVVDPEGRPLPGASVTLFPGFPSRRVPVDDEGRFAISGDGSEPRLFVVASAPGMPDSERLVVESSELELTLVLRAGGTLAGQVLLAERVAPEALVVEIEASLDGEPGRWDGSQRFQLGPHGTFASQPCVPGTARLKLGFNGSSLWSAGVAVRAGAVTRIEPIDLRDALHAIALQVTDEGGVPIERGELTCLGSAGSWIDALELGRDGKVTLVAREQQVDVSVVAPGFRTTTASVRDGDRITLRPGLPVRVHLRVAQALPPGIEHALVFLHDEEWFEVGPARGTSVFDLSLPQSGDYELEWSLRSVTTGVAANVWEDSAQVIHVMDSAAVQEFEAILDPNLVRETLERLLGTGGR